MKVMLAASEAVPFCKTGGLADVVGALAPLLAARGHEVRLFLPKYRAVEKAGLPLERVPGAFHVALGDHSEKASLYRAQWGAVTACFIDEPAYYDRPELYRTSDGDYPDNDERFVFFARAALEGAKFTDFQPDIIHVHDWQAALIPAYLKTLYQTDAFFARCGSLLTVHNFAFQGSYPRDALFLAGFGWADFTPDKLEFYGNFNLLKAGLVYADRVNTVSPTYARQTVESADFGAGLEGVLRHRGEHYGGILNGLDSAHWNPETDAYLSARFGLADLAAGKAANKASLLRDLKLKALDGVPLVGIVSRLDPQKGLDLALEVLPEFLRRGEIQVAMLGHGDTALEQGFTKLAADFPELASCATAGMDEALAHRIYAGADLFLMPSRFEPCGLGQMIAMRYGTVPVATRTGGLADTVRDATQDPKAGNGFCLAAADAASLRDALARARDAFGRKDAFKRVVKNAAAGDYSWERSVDAYLSLYERVLKEVRA